ncbi:protein of unknown function [Kyrpidia spormannii]|uniref:Uncharacterized protein n=2 Tax=Kyrpidia spormannii TaxID=2055160 RepID=A0ACA8ZAS5_9BACL|nr:protein of unknown function [Kyrpidia spormannii]CAB3394056.1 protein of unknown function [Kyrpidia spormannii]
MLIVGQMGGGIHPWAGGVVGGFATRESPAVGDVGHPGACCSGVVWIWIHLAHPLLD